MHQIRSIRGKHAPEVHGCHAQAQRHTTEQDTPPLGLLQQQGVDHDTRRQQARQRRQRAVEDGERPRRAGSEGLHANKVHAPDPASQQEHASRGHACTPRAGSSPLRTGADMHGQHGGDQRNQNGDDNQLGIHPLPLHVDIGQVIRQKNVST